MRTVRRGLNRKKLLKLFIFGDQRRLNHYFCTLEKLVTSSCYGKQQSGPICNRFQARRVDSGKIAVSREVRLFVALV